MTGWRAVDEHCAVIEGAVNIGVIRLDGARVLLVDSGLDRDAGRRAIRAVAEAGWGEVAGILTTHAHADHVGGHPEIVRRIGCPVWAPPVEAAIMSAPELAPAIMFGAAPPGSMRTKFLLPAQVAVNHQVSGQTVTVDGLEIGVVPLPGHAPGQVGYVVGDTCFSADSVFPEDTLTKHVIPYVYDMTRHRQSLETAQALPYQRFVCGHGPVLERDAFRELVSENLAVLDRIEQRVVVALEDAPDAAGVLGRVLDELDGEADTLGAAGLMGVTVRAMLADLADRNEVESRVARGRITWHRTVATESGPSAQSRGPSRATENVAID